MSYKSTTGGLPGWAYCPACRSYLPRYHDVIRQCDGHVSNVNTLLPVVKSNTHLPATDTYEESWNDCVNTVTQCDSLGSVYLIKFKCSDQPSIQICSTESLQNDRNSKSYIMYDMVVFDGSNTQGGIWKHTFLPKTKQYWFTLG